MGCSFSRMDLNVSYVFSRSKGLLEANHRVILIVRMNKLGDIFSPPLKGIQKINIPALSVWFVYAHEEKFVM